MHTYKAITNDGTDNPALNILFLDVAKSCEFND